MLDPARREAYSGKISVYDDPIYIADAAVYLKAHQPDLGIDNPYELDEDQFNAAVDLLKQQKPYVGEYWSDSRSRSRRSRTATSRSERRGSTSTSRSRETASRSPRRPASQGFLPAEGATGLVGHLDDQLRGGAPELHVPVDEPHHRPEGRTPRSPVVRRGAGPDEVVPTSAADPLLLRPTTASSTTRTNPEFWSNVYYWNTPVADCGDDRGAECMDYNDWVSAWTEIKG